MKVFAGEERLKRGMSDGDRTRVHRVKRRTFLKVEGAVSAKVVQGMPPEDAVRRAEGEFKKVYEGQAGTSGNRHHWSTTTQRGRGENGHIRS